MNWRTDIENAPKDGTPFLAIRKKSIYSSTSFNDLIKFIAYDYLGEREITDWDRKMDNRDFMICGWKICDSDMDNEDNRNFEFTHFLIPDYSEVIY